MSAISSYDGVDTATLERRLALPRVLAFTDVPSTLDVAHALAADGADAGTLVVADRQTAGRGRGGRAWTSGAGLGVWLTLVERPADASALDVLSLRLGLRAARALEPFATGAVQVKWPNDLYVDGGKLGGILVEVRWRDRAVDWVAVGIGVNVRQSAEQPKARALAPDVARVEELSALVPVVRTTAAARGPLRPAELRDFERRHYAHGARCVEPTPGVVAGVSATGALLVRDRSGIRSFSSGSLVLESTS